MSTYDPDRFTMTLPCPRCGKDCSWSGVRTINDSTKYVINCGCEASEEEDE